MRLRLAAVLEGLALALACLTVMWGPLAQGSTFGWGMSGLVLLGCLTLAVTLLALSVRGQVRVSNPWWLAAALAFLAWVWASTGWAPYKWEAFRWAGVWTAVIGTAVSLHLLARTRRRQMVVLTVMVLTGAAALALAYLQTRGVFVPGFEYYPGAGTRVVTGPYFNPSHFSGFLIPVAALLTSLILFTRPHLHTLALAGLLVALHWLNLKTDSSSIPAVLLATGLPFLVWVWTKQRVVGSILTALALISALAVGVFFLQPAGQQWFAAHQQQMGLHRDWGSFLAQRRATWRYGREMWRQHPLTGVGIGQLSSESPIYRGPERQIGEGIDRGTVNYAHSDSLQLLAELGLPGLGITLLTLLLPLFGRHPNSVTLVWWTTIPAVLFVGLFDAHATAIPGTAAILFALGSLAAVRRATRTVVAQPTSAFPTLTRGAQQGIEVHAPHSI
ncbi:lipid A core-O-antigen ligase-like enzyme [Deinococcus aerius]|uniref:Lipid A core-O-antigen ligase-like enzyme n=1 Tax=Deinococcus aerius TaxID=200253 RepID=A0A2I9CXB1_9DEIO|nr:O-antigen ligase family protein [Deinococcus aerius]GBF06703.1 lipid A core-O-antigen ligase-like enzyme [Deinococcus aerius]